MLVVCVAISKKRRDVATASVVKEALILFEVPAYHIRDLHEGAFLEFHSVRPAFWEVIYFEIGHTDRAAACSAYLRDATAILHLRNPRRKHWHCQAWSRAAQDRRRQSTPRTEAQETGHQARACDGRVSRPWLRLAVCDLQSHAECARKNGRVVTTPATHTCRRQPFSNAGRPPRSDNLADRGPGQSGLCRGIAGLGMTVEVMVHFGGKIRNAGIRRQLDHLQERIIISAR
jgi:hypothetical protein